MKKEDYVRMHMVEALKAHDPEKKNTLSLLLSALKNAEIENRRALTEEEENAVVHKEIRKIKETLELCPKERTDIISQCERQLDILKSFAPELMDKNQIKTYIENAMLSLGFNQDNPATIKNKGLIMKKIMPELKGKADGKSVNDILGEVLS